MVDAALEVVGNMRDPAVVVHRRTALRRDIGLADGRPAVTDAAGEIGPSVESSFVGRTLLWTGAGLLVSLGVGATASGSGWVEALVWSGGALVPLLVVTIQLAIAIVLCVGWRHVPDGAARLLTLTGAVLLGLLLSAAADEPDAFAVRVLVVTGLAYAGAGLVGLLGLLGRGRLRPALVTVATALLVAAPVCVAWSHSIVPLAVVAVATLPVVYDLAWARRIERLASDETSPAAAWGALALLVALVELLLLALDGLGRLIASFVWDPGG
jgi:FtsH-binding integral membrane protein